MTISKIEDYRNHLTKLCSQAYREGRKHELDNANPDVGWNISKNFKDTNTWRKIQNMLSPQEHLIKLLKAGDEE